MTYPRTSVRQMINNAGGRLRAAGVDSPRVDAELLMAHALTVKGAPGAEPVTRSSLFFRRQDHVDSDTAAFFEKCISRREQREPLQHIMGTVRFAGIDLLVGPGAFIPRPETELIVEWAGKQLRRALYQRSEKSGSSKPVSTDYTIVDLCTGPGTLALGVAHAAGNALLSLHRDLREQKAVNPHVGGVVTGGLDNSAGTGANTGVAADELRLPRIRIIGVDTSDVALDYARRNVAVFMENWRAEAVDAGLSEDDADQLSVSLCAGDVTDPTIVDLIRDTCGGPNPGPTHLPKVDMVVSNPPYVPENTAMSPEVAADPHDAVFAGADGMSVIVPMMAVVEDLSSPGTVVAVEHDEANGPVTSQCLNDRGFTEVEIHKDLAGRDRFVTGIRAAHTRKA
ncbi:HemK/PrmC family methyltransferase [uncultured Corynebacterium sp.]|uniref:N5-glutamine methyltransferase family protein n=1 Tax=uncultured Corynebacterium sp. TaxID=159447 RepID=UPI0025CE4985|nr:HemK/PrmC family methyltransferase [uncultured Corynebacterium sp.]